VKKQEEKKFKEIGEAYSILSDAKKKARYDSGQDMEESFEGFSSKSGLTVLLVLVISSVRSRDAPIRQ